MINYEKIHAFCDKHWDKLDIILKNNNVKPPEKQIHFSYGYIVADAIIESLTKGSSKLFDLDWHEHCLDINKPFNDNSTKRVEIRKLKEQELSKFIYKIN